MKSPGSAGVSPAVPVKRFPKRRGRRDACAPSEVFVRLLAASRPLRHLINTGHLAHQFLLAHQRPLAMDLDWWDGDARFLDRNRTHDFTLKGTRRKTIDQLIDPQTCQETQDGRTDSSGNS